MFSLVTVIIGIAVAVAAAVVTIYYMGSAADSQAVAAQTARLLNEASQINGAVLLYESDRAGESISSLQDLVNANYLKAIPDGNWSISGSSIVRPVDTEAQCKAFNAKMGHGEITPSCGDPAWQDKIVCCQS